MVTRTQAVAECLAGQGDAVGAAVYLDVPREVLIERLVGRWVCNAWASLAPSQ
jgi:adenylate kinase family enzyme